MSEFDRISFSFEQSVDANWNAQFYRKWGFGEVLFDRIERETDVTHQVEKRVGSTLVLDVKAHEKVVC